MTLVKMLALGLVVALPLSACAAGRTIAPADSVAHTAAPIPVSSVRGTIDEKTMTATATVQAIDPRTHVMTLRRPDRTTFTIALPPNGDSAFAVVVAPGIDDVERFAKGDEVTLVYRESVVFQVRKPDQSTPGVAHTSDVSYTPNDEKPGGTVTDTVSVRVPIAAIDRAASTVTVRDVSGTLATVSVPDPSTLDAVAVGDVMDIAYTAAITITVRTPRSPPRRARR